MSDLAEERKAFVLKLLKEAESEIIELIRDTTSGIDPVALHDAKMGIWNAMGRVEAIGAIGAQTLSAASVPNSEEGKS